MTIKYGFKLWNLLLDMHQKDYGFMNDIVICLRKSWSYCIYFISSQIHFKNTNLLQVSYVNTYDMFRKERYQMGSLPFFKTTFWKWVIFWQMHFYTRNTKFINFLGFLPCRKSCILINTDKFTQIEVKTVVLQCSEYDKP